MNYHTLTFSDKPKEIGNRDGLGHGYLDSNFYKKNPWYEDIFIKYVNGSKDWWKIWSQMPEYGQDLVEIKMHSKAQHNDFIDFSGLMQGFLVNDRLREILEKARLPKHSFFSATFLQKGVLVEDYWWFTYDLEIGASTVNFSLSEFDQTWYVSNVGKEFTLNNYEAYLAAFYETGRAAKATKLVFNSFFDQELDIWGTQFLSLQKAYISTKLLAKFKQEEVTGFRITEPRSSLVFTK